MGCDHSGYHSGALRLLQDACLARLVLVCDDCGWERTEIGTIEYKAPKPVAPAAVRQPGWAQAA